MNRLLNEMDRAGGRGINRGSGRSSKACRHACEQKARYRSQLAESLAEDRHRGMPQWLVRGAVGEAEALAWSTPYPMLFLPELVEEKVAAARTYASRQESILRRQQQALAAVEVE